MNEITQPAPSMGPGEVLRAYDVDAPAPEAPVADPVTEVETTEVAAPETETQEAPEPTLPPDVEDMKKNLLRDYHDKTGKVAAKARELTAMEQTLAAREAALQSRIAEYEVYDEFGRIAESDPELAELVAQRVPRARTVLQQKSPNDAVAREMAAQRQALAEIHMDQTEVEMRTAHTDYDEVQPEVERLILEGNLLKNVENRRQLRAVYDLAYKAATAGKTSVAVRTAAQKQVIGQVKQAAAAARIGGSAPAPPPPAEPSSFRSDGRLRSWEEIASDAAKGVRR